MFFSQKKQYISDKFGLHLPSDNYIWISLEDSQLSKLPFYHFFQFPVMNTHFSPGEAALNFWEWKAFEPLKRWLNSFSFMFNIGALKLIFWYWERLVRANGIIMTLSLSAFKDVSGNNSLLEQLMHSQNFQ